MSHETHPGWKVRGQFTPNPYRILPDLVTAEIDLSQGMTCMVDAADLPTILALRWHAARYNSKRVYAQAHQYSEDGKRKAIGMHNLLIGGQADHINLDTLDNRRTNLRPATTSRNACNRMKPSTNKSGFKGVCFSRSMPNRPWVAQIYSHGKREHLGYFHDPVGAARAYDQAARLLHGAFARLNFPNEGEHAA